MDGFTRAMRLRPDAWEALLDRADEEIRASMIFLMALQDINLGESKFTEDEIDEIDSEAPDLIPNCVAAILTQSRPELSQTAAANLPGSPYAALTKQGRNDPCACGSGSFRATGVRYPSEAFQFDWSEDWAYVGGERIKLQVAHIKHRDIYGVAFSNLSALCVPTRTWAEPFR